MFAPYIPGPKELMELPRVEMRNNSATRRLIRVYRKRHNNCQSYLIHTAIDIHLSFLLVQCLASKGPVGPMSAVKVGRPPIVSRLKMRAPFSRQTAVGASQTPICVSRLVKGLITMATNAA